VARGIACFEGGAVGGAGFVGFTGGDAEEGVEHEPDEIGFEIPWRALAAEIMRSVRDKALTGACRLIWGCH
jgi:hypothetical protein